MANKKISDLTELAEGPALGDLLPLVDISDTTDAATGTTKKNKAQYGLGSQVNAQTGTTYTVLTTDFRKLVTHTNGSAIAVTLPQAGASFPAGWWCDVQNRGAGAVTITPTTSTIDGAASLVLNQNEGCRIVSDGTNYFTQRGKGSGSAGGSAGGDLAGTYPNPTVSQSSTSFALTGDISPAQITSNQNDYNPTGLASAAVLRLNTDASRNITSIAGGSDGRLLIIENIGSFNIVLKDDDGATGTAGNRLALSADVTLTPDQCAVIKYDSTTSRWRLLAGPGGGGSGDIKSDGSVAFAADQSMGTHKLTNVTDPGSAQDAATKAYVDAATSGLGTDRTIKAGIAEQYDPTPGSTQTEDDEFNAGSLDAKWTVITNTATSVNFNSTWKSHAYVVFPTGSTSYVIEQAFAPGGAFSLTVCARFAGLSVTNGNAIQIICRNSGDTEGMTSQMVGNSNSIEMRLDSLDASTPANRDSRVIKNSSVSWAHKMYLHLQRDGSNVWTNAFSFDGLVWVPAPTHTKSLTMHHFRISLVSATICFQGLDWVRRDWITL